MISKLEEIVGLGLEEIDELVVAVRGASDAPMDFTLVVTPVAPLESEEGRVEPPRAARLAREARHGDATYLDAGAWCYFEPPRDEGGRFVVASERTLHEIVDAEGAPPPLRRELEEVAAASDRDRHASLLVAPSFLFTEGKALLTGPVAALRDVLFQQLPDEARAALLSAHWGDDFFTELRVASAAELSPVRMVALLDDRIGRWPERLQLAVLDVNPATHGRQVVARLPAMTRLLAEYTRAGVEGRLAVLNFYLPPAAGHNLVMAAELMLAQLSAVGGAAIAVAPTEMGLAEKLNQPASVSFPRDTLEMAVRYLADEIDARIVILGGDIQLEGITKNQSFALDAKNRPAREILLEILQKANPDKSAAGPADPRQRLVYVLKTGEDGRESVFVTTRSAAGERGDPLPAVFGE